jgi:hypothetical protein
MAGLDPATQQIKKNLSPRRRRAVVGSEAGRGERSVIPSFEKIVPVGIVFLDQRYLPAAFPPFDARFSLDRIDVERVLFKPNQACHGILLYER